MFVLPANTIKGVSLKNEVMVDFAPNNCYQVATSRLLSAYCGSDYCVFAFERIAAPTCC